MNLSKVIIFSISILMSSLSYADAIVDTFGSHVEDLMRHPQGVKTTERNEFFQGWSMRCSALFGIIAFNEEVDDGLRKYSLGRFKVSSYLSAVNYYEDTSISYEKAQKFLESGEGMSTLRRYRDQYLNLFRHNVSPESVTSRPAHRTADLQ